MSHHYENYATSTKNFWESCDETFAHLEINKWLENYDELTRYWTERFISKLDFNGKSVVDYGIGGGYLGKFLLDQHGVTHYTGVDISERSIASAEQNLGAHRAKTEFLLSDRDWPATGADIFISQACIQHFPSVPYFDEFLEKLDKSGFSELMLQIRYSPNTFSLPDRPVYGLFTNFDYVSRHLPAFELEYTSPVEDNGYQFGIFKRQGSVSQPQIEAIPDGFYEISFYENKKQIKSLERKLAEIHLMVSGWDLLKRAYHKLTGRKKGEPNDASH